MPVRVKLSIFCLLQGRITKEYEGHLNVQCQKSAKRARQKASEEG